MGNKNWRKSEEKLLRNNWYSLSLDDFKKIFPNRSKGAVDKWLKRK